MRNNFGKLLGLHGLLCVMLLSVACDKKERLPGKREAISGVTVTGRIPISPAVASQRASLTSRARIDAHVDIAGSKQHGSLNYAIPKSPKVLWRTSIGRGPIQTDMISFSGNIYAVNAGGELVCISRRDGKKLWSKQIAKQPDDGVFSGGITADHGIIYASTNIGDVIAIDSKSQKELWKQKLKFPLNGAPIYVSGKLIVTTVENKTYAMEASTGNIAWTKTLSQEQTIMSEFSTPAVAGGHAICAYSTGEVISIDVQSGIENWTEVLLSADMSKSGGVMSHISASPVVTGDTVLVANIESKMELLEYESGQKLWEKDIGTISTPVVNNGWIFLITSDHEVSCFSIKTGEPKWVVPIGTLSSIDNKYRDRRWIGPMLINGEIVIFSEVGEIYVFNPTTGHETRSGRYEAMKGVDIARVPMVVDGKLFALTRNADVVAFG
ncbi:MAG: PQQ-binding-like beta-propeller repeat protein [Holosporales bacterium]|jgi:outer membrane protein assembly factor BamB|nr:PQQ-binding-like beta-propeller repeat protein [Holosporales bacterium]